MIIKKISHIL